MKYATPQEALQNHCEHCGECKTNSFGLCPAGFRLLGQVSGMRKDEQMELLPVEIATKPMVRIFIREHERQQNQIAKAVKKITV